MIVIDKKTDMEFSMEHIPFGYFLESYLFPYRSKDTNSIYLMQACHLYNRDKMLFSALFELRIPLSNLDL